MPELYEAMPRRPNENNRLSQHTFHNAHVEKRHVNLILSFSGLGPIVSNKHVLKGTPYLSDGLMASATWLNPPVTSSRVAGWSVS